MSSWQKGLLSRNNPVAGPGASAIKYDILTALLAMASCGDPGAGRLAVRLSLLITARFNWRQGTFAVGQRELARMWGVTERTAKREMAEMKRRGWIALQVPAARGRVAVHRIDLQRLLRETAPYWQTVGPDFAARMAGNPPEPDVPAAGNVIPLHAPVSTEDGSDTWRRVSAYLKSQVPSMHAAWLADLTAEETETGTLILTAPSTFVANYVQTHFANRLRAAIAMEEAAIRDVRIISI